MKIGTRLSIVLMAVLSACTTVPITGRKQLNLIPQSDMLSMSYQQYDAFLKENKLSTDSQATAMVKSVGSRIQKAVEQYFAEQKMSSHLQGYNWEFNLVESDQVNAWCMPGGKVVVYTGILPLTQDEAGLAVVMGHEIAHAVAEHGNERMSQALLQQLGGVALTVAMRDKPEETRNLWLSLYGVGTTVGAILPYSRLHESEADELGLIFMAMAGYDPNAAIPFWQRMAALKGGQAPPEFLSTHPSDETRIRKIKEILPKAMKYYRPQQ
ncbi:MAG: M48 family metallopeptidase [candidate division KSB1 bacterium]|nr:M48 family metallopeptidase [candidate division KSB1 bacterium]